MRHFKKGAHIRSRKRYADGGEGICLGPSVFVEQWWTPVLFSHMDDPTFYKTDALEQYDPQMCCCGHPKKDHTEYERGTNSKGSKFCCTKDGCDKWAYCDLK